MAVEVESSTVACSTGEGKQQRRWRLPRWRVPWEKVTSVFHGRRQVATELASSTGEGEQKRRWVSI